MPLGVVPQDVSPDALEWAKQSFRSADVDEWLKQHPDMKDIYAKVLNGFVNNVKTKPGGFVATSGVVLPYYLNLSTNFMDPVVAPLLAHLVAGFLLKVHKEMGSPTDKIAIVGMEVAGGMLVAQLAAMGDTTLNDKYDFVYMRKARKSTGTAQQLEGTKKFTNRTHDSPPLRTIWIDDVNSTGSSLCDGINVLKEDYNMDVVMAVYCVDRSVDRQNLPNERQRLSDERFVKGGTVIRTLMDLKEIDPLVKRE